MRFTVEVPDDIADEVKVFFTREKDTRIHITAGTKVSGHDGDCLQVPANTRDKTYLFDKTEWIGGKDAAL